jgi:hypothetical protein
MQVYESDLTKLFTWTCERCNGLTKDFEVIEVIFDVEHCLQAYVGVAKDLNAIIIAFRGTQEHSIQNWVSDLFWKQLDLNYPDMPDAMVHFNNKYLSLSWSCSTVEFVIVIHIGRCTMAFTVLITIQLYGLRFWMQ